jgi:LemA protein
MGKLGLGCVALIVVLAVIVGISMAGTYNRLVTLGQEVDKQWGQVENVYQRRADLVPNLVATVWARPSSRRAPSKPLRRPALRSGAPR